MLFELLSLLLLTIHLLLVNVASAGPLFCIYLERKAHRTGNAVAAKLGRDLAATSMTTLLIGIAFGVLLGLVAWNSSEDTLIGVLPRFTWKISWGIAEVFFSLFCMAIYLRMWNQVSTERRKVGIHRLLAILASTNLLYHFPSLFGVMTFVGRNRNQFGDRISTGEFRRLAYSSEILPLTIHFCIASIAVTAVYVMYRTLTTEPSPHENDSQVNEVRQGAARIALASTAVQVVVGTWLLLKTDAVIQQRLLGGNLIATMALGTSVLLTFVLCHFLASASFGAATPRNTIRSAFVLVILIFLMTAALRQSRRNEHVVARSPTQGAACSTMSLPSALTMRTTLSCPAKTTVSPIRLLPTA